MVLSIDINRALNGSSQRCNGRISMNVFGDLEFFTILQILTISGTLKSVIEPVLTGIRAFVTCLRSYRDDCGSGT